MQDLTPEPSQTIIEGEELMFIMDVPSIPVPQTPIVLAQAATPATPQPDYLLKICAEKASTGDTSYVMNGINPAGGVKNFLQNRDKQYVDMAAIKITLLEGTKHGELEGELVSGILAFMYYPTEGYVGKDSAIFMAEFEGKRYKIIMELHVFDVAPSEYQPSSCPPPQLLTVNGKPVSGASSYDLNSTPVTFADLAGGALGQTSGSTITLDSNAAGYNWFIDTTPADNSEFLPTSNPNEWVAKAGSDAAGKMDMLSVLLHEYGHALGINHSADPNDFMGTTLTAGVRRLPTADEMALMQSLVAEAKATLSPSPSPANGGGEFPTLPLGTSFIGFLGLLRSSRYGGVSIAPDASTLVTQYDWAANTTLVNGSLNAADGWSTQGSVNIATVSLNVTAVNDAPTVGGMKPRKTSVLSWSRY
jgi:hypothetical protein